MRAVLVVAVTLLVARSAAAQPGAQPPARDGRGPYVQLSAGLGVGWLERTTTYTDTDTGGEASSVRPLSSRGAGALVGITGGVDLGNGVRLGGFVRIGYYRMGLESSFAPLVTETGVQTLVLGPAITLQQSRGLHLRVDAGSGTMGSGSAAGVYGLDPDFPFGTLALGAEVGYHRALSADWRIEVALALSATWGRAHEEADRGYYDDRARVVSTALVASFTYGP